MRFSTDVSVRFAETDASSWDRRYTWQFPPGRLIQVDIDPTEIGRNDPPAIAIIADAKALLGAMTRQRDIEFSDAVARRLPLFAEAVRSVGHRVLWDAGMGFGKATSAA